MRIRRRPQPSSLHLAASDPTTSTAPQTPQQNAARSLGWLEVADGEDREAKLLHAGADLGHKSGAARRLALPQVEDNVVVDCGRSMGAQHGVGADDGGHRRFSAVSNGHHNSLDQKDSVARISGVGGKPEPVAAKMPEERVTSNGALQLAVVPAPALAVKEEEKASISNNGSGAAAKKRRGPAVLLEGSRCSRVNGRGWRCSQPTLVGYSLCEHHLGKGRMRSAAAAAAAAVARGRLGRTEHAARTIPAAVVGAVAAGIIPAVAAPPKAEAPSLPPC
ncbi:unnamed protein product [Urochloa humidicola]